jgi:hypothetical protein
MKKCFLILTLFVVTLFANQCFAQSNDPLNQSNKKVNEGWSSQPEQVISKKKKNVSENKTETVVNVKESSPTVKINNSNPDKISVELVSLIGNRASQYVEITIKFTNHDVNEKMSINDFVAYNEEGNEFTDYYPVSGINTFTDVPVKASWKFGKMLPNKNSKMPAMSFKIGDCNIEIRDAVIDWR